MTVTKRMTSRLTLLTVAAAATAFFAAAAQADAPFAPEQDAACATGDDATGAPLMTPQCNYLSKCCAGNTANKEKCCAGYQKHCAGEK